MEVFDLFSGRTTIEPGVWVGYHPGEWYATVTGNSGSVSQTAPNVCPYGPPLVPAHCPSPNVCFEVADLSVVRFRVADLSVVRFEVADCRESGRYCVVSTSKHAPPESSLRTSIVQPWASMIVRTIARPNPEPEPVLIPYSKIFSRCSGRIPGPSSAM